MQCSNAWSSLPFPWTASLALHGVFLSVPSRPNESKEPQSQDGTPTLQ